MKNNPTATQNLNRRFLLSLLVISLIISCTELIVMMVLELYQKSGGGMTSLEETFVDTLFLTLISGPLLWFVVMRRLVVTITHEQQKVSEQDRQNKELLTALDAHALVSITDKKGKIVYANDKFSQISGYSYDELIGKDHRIINSGTHDKSFFRDMWQTIVKGQTWQGFVCNRNKGGALYWVDSTIVPLLDEKGIPRQYISIRRDITGQKENEARLRTLKRAVDACSEMILITDADGAIQYANPALYEFSGWREEELLNRPVSIFNSSNNPSTVLDSLKRNVGRGESWSGRLISKRKGIPPLPIAGQSLPPDPLEFWSEINITPVFNDDASLFGYVQIVRDISALVYQEAKEEMDREDSKARLEIADTLQRNVPLKERFENTLNILFNLNALNVQRKGGVFLKSETGDALEMFVLSGNFSDEFIGKEKRVPLGECLCGRAAVSNELLVSDDCFCDPRHERQFKGMQAHGHFIVPLAVGEEVLGVMFLYTNPYPQRNDDRLMMLRQVGEVMAMAVMREQAQRALESARDLAMQASETKSEFLANVSHEIRTPMNGVLGMLDLLKSTDLSRTQAELVETAGNSAESLLEILNDILDFSKLEAGKIEVEKINFNLGDLVEEVATLLSGRAFMKGLELNCSLPPDLSTQWLGDPNRIRQVITNLLGNAIKFTEQGEISITLFPVAKNENEQIFRFEIRDSGIGIPHHVQDRLFQPFSQADAATSRRYGGTGLGLSICKSLISLMGGIIGVESEAGRGSCFWFELPLTVFSREIPELSVDFDGKRILVVDDNATNRTILEHNLNHWGFIVKQADSGQVALIELERAQDLGQSYDLIILDMHMPGMDGVATIGKLQDQASLNKIPRILLSSGALIDEKQRQDLGLASSLLKPVRQSQLFDVIADVLNSQNRSTTALPESEKKLFDYSDRRVLIVEDNKVNQKVLSGFLAKFNVRPEIACDGRIALDRLANEDFDLIFMDCQMPVLDGYETTTEIRRQERETGGKSRPIIALTANASGGEREKCLAAGMDDYLSKPIRRDQLTEMLSRWLGPSIVHEDNARHDSTQNIQITVKAEAVPLWDENAALNNLGGDKELLIEIMTVFLEEMPDMLTKLSEANERNDLQKLAEIVHTIKGSVSNFKASSMVKNAAALENTARGNHAENYRTITDRLIDDVNNLLSELREYVRANASD